MGLPDLGELVQMMGGGRKKRDMVNDPGKLKQFAAVLLDSHQFKPGDLIQWKPGLKNKTIPEYDAPAVVTRVYGSPIVAGEDQMHSADGPLFHEPLDIVCGILSIHHCDDEDCKKNGETEFDEYHYDSRRFMHYVPDHTVTEKK